MPTVKCQAKNTFLLKMLFWRWPSFMHRIFWGEFNLQGKNDWYPACHSPGPGLKMKKKFENSPRRIPTSQEYARDKGDTDADVWPRHCIVNDNGMLHWAVINSWLLWVWSTSPLSSQGSLNKNFWFAVSVSPIISYTPITFTFLSHNCYLPFLRQFWSLWEWMMPFLWFDAALIKYSLSTFLKRDNTKLFRDFG